MKNNKGISSIILLICSIIILLVAVVFWLYAQNYSKSSEKNSNQNSSTLQNNKLEAIESNEEEEEENTNSSHEYASLWNGEYTDDYGNKITIYRDGKNTVCVKMLSSQGMSSQNFEGIEVTSENQLEYEETFFGDTTSFIIEKISNNKWNVKASSTDEENICNVISGTYVKKEYDEKGWSGRYIAGEDTIILSEYMEGKMIISINSYWQRYLHDFDSEVVTYEDSFFDSEEKIVIIKTNDGIIIESSSTDEDDILNVINEKEFKKAD